MMNRAERPGFSIVEVMIAVLIIGATMSPLVFMFSRSTSGTVQTRDEVVAYGYASELLEFAMARRFDDFPVGDNQMYDEIKLKTGGGAEIPLKVDSRFTRRLHVRVPPITGAWPYQYKVLVAEVGWVVTPGQTKKIQVTGLLTKGK